MKLRTTHNSIRIRIRKSELIALNENHSIDESIGFPSGVLFKFLLKISKASTEVNANLNDNCLEIALPKDVATHWINTNQVGIEAYLNITKEEQLHILIEKDFPCLDRENEDKSDTFFELVPEKLPEVC